MQVVAHTGPNWNQGALAVQSESGLVAIGVRNTVVLYDQDGNFAAEIRAVGRGRVTALSFCCAHALSHLLAVGTADGFVRIFDVQSKRIFRRVVEPPQRSNKDLLVTALQFFPCWPHVIIVVSADKTVKGVRYDDPNIMKLVCSVSLGHLFGVVSSLECLRGKARVIVVGGTAKKTPSSGIVAFVQVSVHETIINHQTHDTGPVHDVSLRMRAISATDSEYILALISGCREVPSLYNSTDCKTWTKVGDDEYEKLQTLRKEDKGLSSAPESRGRHRSAVAWCGDRVAVSSNARGLITAWCLDNTGIFRAKTSHEFAHVRQVFALVSIGANGLFYSISMDRTLAAWRINGMTSDSPCIDLRWRTIRTPGAIRCIALSKVDSALSLALAPRGEVRGQHSYILSYCSFDSVITCITWNRRNNKYAVLGEVSPLGSSSGKRKREPITHLATYPMVSEIPVVSHGQGLNLNVFGSKTGDPGIVRLRDRRLEFTSSKKRPLKNVTSWPIAGFAEGCKGSVLTVDSKSQIKEWVVPADASPTTSFVAKSAKTCSVFHETTDGVITAVCPILIEKTDDTLLLLGSSSGNLCVVSQSGLSLMNKYDTKLSSITFICRSEILDIIAISDSDGTLATFFLDLSKFYTNGDRKLGDQSISLRQILRNALPSPILQMTWSDFPDSKDQSNNCPVFLTTLPLKRDPVVWEYGEDGFLTKRAELKGHVGQVFCTSWLSNEYIFTSGADGTIRRWNIVSQPRI